MYSRSLFEIALESQADKTPPISLNDIVNEASQLGHGSIKELKRRFVRYQELGLIGKSMRKEKRKGGQGLWHPGQAGLFMLYLRLRKENRSDTISLANIPIGIWLLEVAFGKVVTVEQAQRAFYYSTKDYPKLWSNRIYGLEQNYPGTPITKNIRETSAKFDRRDRDNLKAFYDLDFDSGQPGISHEAFMSSGFRIKGVDSNYQDIVKAAYYKEVSNRTLAMKYKETLSKASFQPLWEVARELWLDSFEKYLAIRDGFKYKISMSIMPETGNEIIENSMIYLLGALGYCIYQLQQGHSLIGLSGNFAQYFIEADYG
jgi:hypothetical protein